MTTLKVGGFLAKFSTPFKTTSQYPLSPLPPSPLPLTPKMFARSRISCALSTAEALSALNRAEQGLYPSVSASLSGESIVVALRHGVQKLSFSRDASECVDETLRRIGKKAEPALLGPAPKRKPAVTINENGEKVIDRTPPKARVRLTLLSNGTELCSSHTGTTLTNAEGWPQCQTLCCHELCPETEKDIRTFAFPILHNLPEVLTSTLELSPGTSCLTNVPQSVLADVETAVRCVVLWFVYDKMSSEAPKQKKQKKEEPKQLALSDLQRLNAEFAGVGDNFAFPEKHAGRHVVAVVVPLSSTEESAALSFLHGSPSDSKVGQPAYVELSTKPLVRMPFLDEIEGRFPAPCTQETTRVLTYNILYDGATVVYKTGDSMYPYTRPEVLDIAHRRQALLYEITHFAPSIMCFQEMQTSLHETYFTPKLAPLGYKGVHLPKLGQGMREGVSTLFDSTRFELVEKIDTVLGGEDIMKGLESRRTELWVEGLYKYMTEDVPKCAEVLEKTATVAQIVALRDLLNPSEVTVVGNTHLWFHPKGSHIRVIQLHILLHIMRGLGEKLGEGVTVKYIVCGDLNCQAKSAPHRFMVSGGLPVEHPAWGAAPGFDFTRWDFDGEVVAAEETCTIEDPLPGPALTHPLGLQDATPDFPFTNYTPGFTGRLDYILHSKGWSVSHVQPLPSTTLLAKEGGGIPSSLFPSDHLPVCVDLVRA